jgi:hypothetical protein
MKLYKKKWWKKLFQKKESPEKIDTLKDIKAIKEFLNEIQETIKPLKKEVDQLEELEKEREIANEKIMHINLDTQAEVIDKLIERYDYLKSDVDINSLRIRKITKKFLINAQKAGMKDLVKEKKKDDKWLMRW